MTATRLTIALCALLWSATCATAQDYTFTGVVEKIVPTGNHKQCEVQAYLMARFDPTGAWVAPILGTTHVTINNHPATWRQLRVGDHVTLFIHNGVSVSVRAER